MESLSKRSKSNKNEIKNSRCMIGSKGGGIFIFQQILAYNIKWVRQNCG